MPEKPFYTTLDHRAEISVSGPDRYSFMQGLITQDINLLKSQPLIYACLLNAQGKFLHDFFIREENNSLLLDCEGGERVQDLAKRFNMYKLRAQVEIEMRGEKSVFVILNGEGHEGLPDPRHPEMGLRAYQKPEGIEERSFEEWDRHRIALTIPDGSRDLIPEKSTMEEARIDQLNGVNYQKGCYVGQELTARVHYRGLGKKHLYALQGPIPAFGEPLIIGEKQVGETRSSCGDMGLALIKDEDLKLFSGSEITLLKSTKIQ